MTAESTPTEALIESAPTPTLAVEWESPCGRSLIRALSTKDGGIIAVLATPASLLWVVDVDGASLPTPPDALGYAVTPRGSHFYFSGPTEINGMDRLYAAEALELVAEYEAALVLARKALAPFAANADPRIPPGSSHRASRAVEKINAVLEKEGD